MCVYAHVLQLLKKRLTYSHKQSITRRAEGVRIKSSNLYLNCKTELPTIADFPWIYQIFILQGVGFVFPSDFLCIIVKDFQAFLYYFSVMVHLSMQYKILYATTICKHHYLCIRKTLVPCSCIYILHIKHMQVP